MVEKLTKAQAGSLGGKKTWASVKENRRKKKMSDLAITRWEKYRAKQS